ncbi:MAG TPA: fumarylacetoacetate hydrolase family protein, partial [Microbacteriaceae bacterium]|nr:fumarylacetoacetate hydrolase family protein [Microbacteriaceae bacterium]
MKIAHLQFKNQPDALLAIVSDDQALLVRDLRLSEPLNSLQDLILDGPEILETIFEQISQADTKLWQSLEHFTFLPAVINPPITLAVGLNYDEHASELKLDNDAGPVLFTLFPNSLSAHQGNVEIRPDISTEIDYEGELGVIIGKPAKDVTPEEALDYVFGYTITNDITARDIQFREPQWSRCKSFDGFTPVGPWVVTADEIPNP